MKTHKKITLIFILSVILMISVLSAAALDSNWHQFQRDEQNTGVTYSPAPTEDVELAWNTFTYGSEMGNGIDVTPIIAGDIVYIYAANGSIWAFDKTSGNLIWKNETTGGNLQTSTPAYGDGKIFVAAESGDLFAFDAVTGEELWNIHATNRNFECPITYFDHKIYIGEGLSGGVTTKYYYCYDDNGTQLWSHANDDTGGFLWNGATVVADYLVYATHEGELISLYRNNGTLVDEVNLTSDLSFSQPDLGRVRASVTYHDGYVYATSEKGQPVGYVFKVGFDNGTFVDDGWSTANGFSTSTPVVYDGKVYAGQGEHGFTGNLTCLNDSTGEIIWSYFVDAGVKSSPAISIQDGKPYIYFTGAKTNGSSYCLNADGTLAWEYNPPDGGYILQGAAISDGFVYFGTDGGYVYCLNESTKIPDIIPTLLTPTTLCVNRSNEIMVMVKNEGGSADSFNVSLKHNETLIGINTINMLKAGEEKITEFSWTPTSTGTFRLTVIVDPENTIEESNETNNERCWNVTVETPMPDLVPGLLMPPPTIYSNHSNTISATVRNNGLDDAPAFNVSFSANGAVVDTASVSGLTAGGSTTVSFTWTPSEPGSHKLCVLADCYNETVESNETNNERCKNAIVKAPNPDLIIQKIALKTVGYVGEENRLGVKVTNIGLLSASLFNITLEVDGTLLGEATVPSLDAGNSTELEFVWIPTVTGGHELTATADSEEEVEESDETNNTLTRTSVIVTRKDWTQFHYDDTNIGFSPSIAPNTNETMWISDNIGAHHASSVTIADGRIFVYCGDYLVSLDEYTGAVLWNVSVNKTPDVCGSWVTPAYNNGFVFLSAKETCCFNAINGSLVWMFEPPTGKGAVDGGCTVSRGMVVTSDWDGGHYYCLNVADGTEIWNFTVDGKAQSTPAVSVADDRVFFCSYGGICMDGGVAYCVDMTTGDEIWNFTTGNSFCGSVTIGDGVVYLPEYNFYGDGALYALYSGNGTVKWNKTVERTDSTPALAYGNVYVCGGCLGFSDLMTYCFNATNGDLLWNTSASDELGNWKCSVAVADEKVFVGKPYFKDWVMDYAGTYALDAFTGDIIWSYPGGGSSPAIADSMVFTVGSGRVYAFSDTGTGIAGDVNGDCEVTIADASLALQMAVCGEWQEEADVNRDGKVTSLDALMILQVAVGNI